jgi:surface antigen
MVQGSGAAVYLMENGNRRLIPNPPTLDSMGLNWNNIQHIADTDLNNIPDGASLPSRANGAMVQGSGAAVYLMENGNRRLIPDPETFNTMRLDWNAIQHIADTDLNNIAEGAPLPSISANHHILTYQELVNSWRNWSDYTTRNPFPDKGKNCTWYAYGRMLQLGYSKAALDTMRGNAGTWDNTAGNGATVSRIPQVPCLAVWEIGVGGVPSAADGGVGHVAVVERINPDGSILISESNWADQQYSTRTISRNDSHWPSEFVIVPKA